MGAGTESASLKLSDEELLQEHVNGNEKSLAELYRRYERRLTVFAGRALGDWNEAEDFVQMTFMRVHQNAWRFRRTGRFSNWVYTIISNLIKNEFRRRKHRPVLYTSGAISGKDADTLTFEAVDVYTPQDMLEEKELAAILQREIRALSSAKGRALLLRLNGLSYEEVAESTDTDIGTVKSRIHRAKVPLFDRMNRY